MGMFDQVKQAMGMRKEQKRIQSENERITTEHSNVGMFDQVKQAMQMRKEQKRIQAEIERITAEYSNGGITCTVRGDFTVISIKVSPDAFKDVIAGKPERFTTMLTNVVNGALKQVKAKTQEVAMKLMQSGDLNSILGG